MGFQVSVNGAKISYFFAVLGLLESENYKKQRLDLFVLPRLCVFFINDLLIFLQ